MSMIDRMAKLRAQWRKFLEEGTGATRSTDASLGTVDGQGQKRFACMILLVK